MPTLYFLKGGDILKPINPNGHIGYQKSVVSLLKQYYSDANCRFSPSIWKTIDSFFNLDLSGVDIIMSDRYSVFGPRPRLPSCMLRSMLLSLVFKKTSFTDRSAELKMNPLSAIPHAHAPKRKVRKPSNPNDKADSVEAFSVESLRLFI